MLTAGKLTEWVGDRDGAMVDFLPEIESWTDIVQIACSGNDIVGLKKDGTVVACIGNYYWKNVVIGGDYSEWTDVVKISTAGYILTGIKDDGTIVAQGDVSYKDDLEDFSEFKDIVDITGFSYNLIAGVTKDGKVLMSEMGNVIDEKHDEYAEWALSSRIYEARDWEDIIQITSYDLYGFLVGLKSDGTVVAAGAHPRLEEEIINWNLFDVDNNTIIIGDLNGDAKISISDLIILAKSLAKRIELTENQKLISDLNDDSEVTSDDLLIFIKYLVGEIDSLPYKG